MALIARSVAPTIGAIMLILFRFLSIWALLALVSGPISAQLFDRNDQCRAGQFACGSRCCSGGQRCSFDNHCIPLGGTYCGGGRSCGPFERCVAGGLRCAPKGANACTTRLDCPGDSFCNARGECQRNTPEFDPDSATSGSPITCDDGLTCAAGSSCLPGGGCAQPGWFLCEKTGSQCRPGFKCSNHQGCVPVKAIDCGYGKWCKPGEQCLPEGGCEKLP
ncbi:scavenger receptor class F, member 2 [Ruegeria faecimaris]|uniref:scavenger receptor class F, member 2 n=1 Tax=Ruegeria faecimaris TaxID=686389 RepID=UPI00232B2082|nr:scavenger receptor class F, member 2 [Ruegeria faecimaris]